MSLLCGFIAVFITLEVRRRSRLIRAGLFVGLSTWILALIFGLIGPIIWEVISNTHWKIIGLQSMVAIGSGIITAFMVSGALPLFESAFRITTNISWLELADLNHPLLKRLVIEAPGTYHHRYWWWPTLRRRRRKRLARVRRCAGCAPIFTISGSW